MSELLVELVERWVVSAGLQPIEDPAEPAYAASTMQLAALLNAARQIPHDEDSMRIEEFVHQQSAMDALSANASSLGDRMDMSGEAHQLRMSDLVMLAGYGWSNRDGIMQVPQIAARRAKRLAEVMFKPLAEAGGMGTGAMLHHALTSALFVGLRQLERKELTSMHERALDEHDLALCQSVIRRCSCDSPKAAADLFNVSLRTHLGRRAFVLDEQGEGFVEVVMVGEAFVDRNEALIVVFRPGDPDGTWAAAIRRVVFRRPGGVAVRPGPPRIDPDYACSRCGAALELGPHWSHNGTNWEHECSLHLVKAAKESQS